jgi:hypothetical protein
MPSQPLGYGCVVESVGAGVLGDPGLGEEAGAGDVVAGGAVAGGAVAGGAVAGDAVAGGAVAGGAVAGGAGLVAPPPEGAGLALPGSVGMVRLCFCASGMTKGPF